MLQDCELMAGVGVGQLLRFVRGLYGAPLDLASLADALDLGDLLGRRSDRLSGAQAQRVRFALALTGNPALVLDEPTASLDVQARGDLSGRPADGDDRQGAPASSAAAAQAFPFSVHGQGGDPAGGGESFRIAAQEPEAHRPAGLGGCLHWAGVPSAVTRPAPMSTIRSACWSASSR